MENSNAEKSYHIALRFLTDFGQLVIPDIINDEHIKSMNELFYYVVCLGDEATPEWKGALMRHLGIFSGQINKILLDERELLGVIIEFCKIYNQRWEGGLELSIDRIEQLKGNQASCPRESALLKKAVNDVLKNNMKGGTYKEDMKPALE